jgi:hypothetical protein
VVVVAISTINMTEPIQQRRLNQQAGNLVGIARLPDTIARSLHELHPGQSPESLSTLCDAGRRDRCIEPRLSGLFVSELDTNIRNIRITVELASVKAIRLERGAKGHRERRSCAPPQSALLAIAGFLETAEGSAALRSEDRLSG